ncbi:MAG: hemagglutinin repeat-containing protein, partial [Fusobacteriales bacterium]|nr:hemagglutinin repeat-containing protein [Fusobacteriales bacterium]
QLTTKEDAVFAGVNIKADKIDFEIGRNLDIISLQDENKSAGKNWGAGLNVSGKIPGTAEQTGSARPTIGGNYGENHQDSKWVNNQTSIIAENGGNIKVGETLTNVGSIIGSLNEEKKLSIEAEKVVVENLKDHNEGSNYGIGLSGVGLGSKENGNKTPIGQTSVQYGSHDKQQDSNATFVNTEVTEAGKKLNLEELGINTDINKAQIVTKDKVVEQIDTELHTDLLNETTRNQVIRDINGLVQLPADIVRAIQATTENEGSNFLDNLVGVLRSTDADMHNMLTMDKKYKEFKEKQGESPEERAYEALKLANESAEGLRDIYGIEKEVPITVLFADETKSQEAGAFYKEDGSLLIFLDPSVIDMSDSKEVFNGLMYEMNHYNPSNPYVYDKSEKDVEKGYKLEEDFTGIGRKPVTGEGNNFYNDILKGTDILGLGNLLYSNIREEDLDFAMAGDNPTEQRIYDQIDRNMDRCTGNQKCEKKVNTQIKKGIEEVKKEEVKVTETHGKSKTGKPQLTDTVIKISKSESTAEKKNEKALKEFKDYTSENGIPKGTEIVFKTETGETIRFTSFDEFMHWGTAQEKLEHEKNVELGNAALEKSKTAKTEEEKAMYEAQYEHYYSLVHEKMQNVENRQSLAGKDITSNYLMNSAVSYDGRTLTVSAEKYAGEIGAEHIGIFFEGTGKIATEPIINKITNVSNSSGSKNTELSEPKSTNTEKVSNSHQSFGNLDSKLMKELESSGVKYSKNDVVMVTKTSDGKLLWLENGNNFAGLKHIVNGHAANFADKGITNIPSFLNQILQTKPINVGRGIGGPYADYLVNGSTYRVAYGTNGFIVSFYPIK